MTDDVAFCRAMLRGPLAGREDEVDSAIQRELGAVWLPDPSNDPQTRAYHSEADILLYGGAAGGGKTDLLLGLALTAHERTVLFRRTFVDGRGMRRRAFEILGSRKGYNNAEQALRLPDRVIEFGSLERPGAELSWQGRPHDLIGFDEGAQLTEQKVSFVMGWLRSEKPGQRCRVVIASNPPTGAEGEWILRWFAPWLDPAFPDPARPGKLRWRCMRRDGAIAWVDGPGTHAIDGEDLQALSCTFIPARLDDNHFLRDTNYRANVMGLPEPLRAKMLHGDFLAGKQDADNQVIPSAWIAAAQARWREDGGRDMAMTTIGVDVAQGGPDSTVLAALHGNWFAPLIRRRGIDTTNGPAVAELVIAHLRDRPQINIDFTGGWGGSARDHLRNAGFRVEPVIFSGRSFERTRDGELGFANLRSQLWWRVREALDPVDGDRVALPPDPRLAAQLSAPTWRLRGEHILIEAKDDIRRRLGSSTDDADAVILAWHERDRALRRPAGRTRLNPARAFGWGHGPDAWMGD